MTNPEVIPLRHGLAAHIYTRDESSWCGICQPDDNDDHDTERPNQDD